MAVKEVINLGSAIKAGKVEIREVTNEIDEEETSLRRRTGSEEKDSGTDRTGFDGCDEGIRKASEETRRLREARFRNRSERSRRRFWNVFKQMNLRDTQINKIVQKMKQMLIRVEKGGERDKKD